MIEAFDRKIHYRRSVRLKDCNYSQIGAYFITINSYQREILFGEILDSKITINQYGQAANECWSQLSEHFKHVETDAFIVMPNHVHGILMFSSVDHAVGAQHAVPLQERFARPVPGSLSTVVRSFKSATSRRINLLRNTPAAPVWQRNYYEHIIRSDKELNKIREYIQYNPAKWEE